MSNAFNPRRPPLPPRTAFHSLIIYPAKLILLARSRLPDSVSAHPVRAGTGHLSGTGINPYDSDLPKPAAVYRLPLHPSLLFPSSAWLSRVAPTKLPSLVLSKQASEVGHYLIVIKWKYRIRLLSSTSDSDGASSDQVERLGFSVIGLAHWHCSLGWSLGHESVSRFIIALDYLYQIPQSPLSLRGSPSAQHLLIRLYYDFFFF